MKKYFGDYHTHTRYSDGKALCRENIEAAIKKGLFEIGITDHGFKFPTHKALSRKSFLTQKKEMEELKKEYSGRIKIYHGIEANIISLDGSIDLVDDEIFDKEILIVGYHRFAVPKSLRDFSRMFLVSNLKIKPSDKKVKDNTKAIISAIKKYPIDIIAHINYLLKVDCYEVAKAAADYGTYIELNEKHCDSLSCDMFEGMLKTKVEFILNSDAHKVESIANYKNIEKFLSLHNVDVNRIANIENVPVFKDKSKHC